jgi:hypothetical protein
MRMSDDDFIAQLESCTLPEDRFHHADHLHAAWLYFARFPAEVAIAKFSEVLRSYAASRGKPDRYHQTITWAYLLLLNERIERSGPRATWEQHGAVKVIHEDSCELFVLFSVAYSKSQRCSPPLPGIINAGKAMNLTPIEDNQTLCTVWNSRREESLDLRVSYRKLQQNGCKIYTISRIEELECLHSSDAG